MRQGFMLRPPLAIIPAQPGYFVCTPIYGDDSERVERLDLAAVIAWATEWEARDKDEPNGEGFLGVTPITPDGPPELHPTLWAVKTPEGRFCWMDDAFHTEEELIEAFRHEVEKRQQE